MRRVLVSHSWDHPESHARLTDLLRRHDYDYFDHSVTVDAPLPTTSTESLHRELSDRIGRVSAVVVMCTSDVHKKPTVGFEIDEALRQGKRVIAVKPWGDAEGPVPAVIEGNAHAIVGFRGDQIVPAIEGSNIRNLGDYLISEQEDARNLAHWIIRAGAGAVLVGSLTAKHWLPKVNSALAGLGYEIVWTQPPPTANELARNGAIGVGLGLLLALLLDGDARLALTLTTVGAAVAVGGTVLKRLALNVVEGPDGFVAQYRVIL